MTKILSSRYSLLKNFEEDISGLFLFKLKRRDITRKLLAFSRVLNKIEPIRLSDLLIRKKKRIRSGMSFDIFKFRKIRFFYGFLFGKTKTFNKFKYKALQKFIGNRLVNSVLSFEARLDVSLLRICLFISIIEARIFISKFGVLVNGQLIRDYRRKLTRGDILSFTKNTRAMLQRKLYLLTKSRPFSLKITIKDLINRELKTSLTLYTWLFKRYTRVSLFLIYGFPRYFEVNINTMEFYFYGMVLPKDVTYPFKTSISERKYFFSNYI